MNHPHPQKPVTLKDIAQSLGVTLATVSLAMRDDRRISAKRREEVKAAAVRMGYRANPAATTLASYKRASTVRPIQAAMAWINAWDDPDQLRSYTDFNLYWKGAERCAEKFGFRLEEFKIDPSMTPQRLEKILLTRNIRSILLPPHGRQSAINAVKPAFDLNTFDLDNFSMVRFGHTIKLPIHCVTSDQTGNGMMAFNKIRERGYRRIAFVGRANQARFFGAGFLWAQSQMPEESRLPMFLFPEDNENKDAELQQQFFAWLKRTKPDAIFHDVEIVSRMLQKARYRLPEDIGLAASSVFGPEDKLVSAGVDQNPEEIGRVAVLVLLSQINDNARGLPAIPRNVFVQGRWVDGPSLPSRA